MKLEGKVSENLGKWVQPSKYGRSLRKLLQCLKSGMIGAKYAMQPSGAGYKVSSQNNWHKQSKGEMKWNKSFAITISPSQKYILAIK